MARFFEQKFSWVILLLSVPLLFLPKINLLSITGETAGIRIDDIILFTLGILFMWAHMLLHKKIYKIEMWILLLTLFSVFSFLSNRFLFSSQQLPLEAKIFYTGRLFEYFIFFYIGALASSFISLNRLVWIFFSWNILLMLLQKFDLLGAITTEGYQTSVSTRVQGIASFPSEMGLLMNLFFCFLACGNAQLFSSLKFFPSILIRHFLRHSYLYGLFILCGVFVVFTGNRISIVALIVCFLGFLKNKFRWNSLTSLVAIAFLIPIFVIGMGFLITQTASVYDRSTALFSYKNLELAQAVWQQIDMSKNPLENEVVSSKNYDVSWWIRIHKWVYVLKAYVSHPECYLQGLGPGCAWSALDGGFLRIFTEYGLIGSFLFWQFFRSLYRINPQLKWMMIAFFLNMIFFDAYLAYKTMSFLLFIAGYAFERKHRKFSTRSVESLVLTHAKNLNFGIQ